MECGAPAVVCPACGEPAAPSNRFCRTCGHALAGAEPRSGAAGEARGIAERLGCRPLLDRADTIQPAGPPAPAPEQQHRPAAEPAGNALLHPERNHA